MVEDTTPTPPVKEKLVEPNVAVHSFKPSELFKFAKGRTDIHELLSLGFGVAIDEENPDQILLDEYDHGDDRTSVFLAEVGGKIVGSLYLIHWKNNESDKRGGPLSRYLHEHGGEFINLSQISEGQTLACDIGIVVHPNSQGQGIVSKLYEDALDKVRPIFLVGQTKTAAAPVSRARALTKQGYSTFYGGLPVFEDEMIGNQGLGRFTTDMYYAVRSDRAIRVGESGIHYDPADEVLQPDINVDFDRLPPNVARVFRQIIEADKVRPPGNITFGVLVSVDRRYVLPNG